MNKEFQITSGKIVLSDPCYTIPTWCQGVIENVKNGEWVADVEKTDGSDGWGVRVSAVFAYHKDSHKERGDLKDALVNGWGKVMDFDGGVDSGQFGFFDHEHYRNDKSAKDLPKYDFGRAEESGEEWYMAVCNLTLSDEQWGVLPFGVVSSSGYGDGSYSTYAVQNENGEYIGFITKFIFEDEEEADEWDED